MTFRQAEIGSTYDIGLATRDGSTLACLDDNGNVQNVSQMAYMFAVNPGQQQTETADLVRKDQLTRLSSANIIDREFTLYPQAQQGNWVGGELQRIFTDPTAYWQGRGIIWPSPPMTFVPAGPALQTNVPIGNDNLGNAFTSLNEVYGFCAGGYLATFGVGFAHGFKATSAAGNLFYIVFTQVSAGTNVCINLVAKPIAATVITGVIFFLESADVHVYRVDWTAGIALNAPTQWATLPNNATLIASAFVGSNLVLAVAQGVGQPVRIFTNVATTFADVTIPPGVIVTSLNVFGNTLYIAGSDETNAYIFAFDLTASTTTLVVQLPAYTDLRIGVVAGAVVVLASTLSNIAGTGKSVDLYLLTGSNLQFATHLPPFIIGLPPSVDYGIVQAISNVVGIGPYAMFVVAISPPTSTPPQHLVCAYDVTHGSFFTAVDQFPLRRFSGVATPLGIGVVPGGGPGSNNTPYGDFSLGMAGEELTAAGAITQTMRIATFSSLFQDGTGAARQFIAGGRIVSSVVDFTSAAVKLFRQIVITHEPIPAGGSFSVYVYMDVDLDALPATTTYSLTNSTVGSTVTTLILNKIAKKLIYIVDWPTLTGVSSPHPISVAIQAATGWIWQTMVACSNFARVNGQQSNTFCFSQQGQNIDAKVAYNFARQLWRQRGGQCLATFPNGDQYNAAIESASFTSPKPNAITTSSDRKTRWETNLALTIREDL